VNCEEVVGVLKVDRLCFQAANQKLNKAPEYKEKSNQECDVVLEATEINEEVGT
jgi:hypothetical protein